MAGPDEIDVGTDPETGLPFGVGEDTGLPTTIGTGNLVNPEQAGSDVVSEAGTKGDPDYDPDFQAFASGAAPSHPDDPFNGEVEMGGTDARTGQPIVNGESVSTKTGDKASSSFRGITDSGINKSGKVYDPARELANKKNSALADQYLSDTQRLKSDTDEKKTALDAFAHEEAIHFTNMADIRKQQLDFNIKAQRAEELAAAESRKNADQYIGAYREEMSGVRQLMMQTGNPLGGLTKLQGGAMGAALFAQGFLGARYGIKIDVGNQINHWVEQEMQAHQNQVSNLSNAAQGELSLYNIARQQGLDDQITRDRLKGFVIDAMKSNIYMEAARYQSANAMNDAKIKAADLDALQLTNEQTMRNKLVDQQMDILKTEIDAAHKQASDSIQWAANSLERQREARIAKNEEWARNRQDKQDEAANNPQPVPISPYRIIPDPGKPVMDDEGKVVAYENTWMLQFLAGLTEQYQADVYKDITDRSALYEQGLLGLKNVRTLLDQDPDAMKQSLLPEKYQSEHTRAYRRKILATFMDARHALFGSALTGTEKGDFETFYGEDYLFQPGNNAGAIDDFEQMMRDKFTSTLRAKGALPYGQGATPIDSKMNITNARTESNLAPEKKQSMGEEREGVVRGIHRDLPGGSASSTYQEYASGRKPSGNGFQAPTLEQGYTQSDRAIDALARQVALALDNKNVKQASDGMNTLQRIRNTNNGYAAFIMDKLKQNYPILAEAPTPALNAPGPISSPSQTEEPASRVPMKLE